MAEWQNMNIAIHSDCWPFWSHIYRCKNLSYSETEFVSYSQCSVIQYQQQYIMTTWVAHIPRCCVCKYAYIQHFFHLLTSQETDGKCEWCCLLFRCKYRAEHSEALVNVPDFKGWTPLHYACSENNLELIQRLLEVGADPNARYYSIQHP